MENMEHGTAKVLLDALVEKTESGELVWDGGSSHSYGDYSINYALHVVVGNYHYFVTKEIDSSDCYLYKKDPLITYRLYVREEKLRFLGGKKIGDSISISRHREKVGHLYELAQESHKIAASCAKHEREARELERKQREAAILGQAAKELRR